MKSHKNFIFTRLAVLVFVLMATLAVFFIGSQLETIPSEDSQMDRWVGIATVCTAIASIVIGLITIWVMFDQQKIQNELIRYQKMEHQPNFIIKLSQYYGHDEEGEDSSYEELTIHNMGNKSFLIKNIHINTYITWDFEFKQEHFTERIHFFDYFIRKDRSNDDDIILIATNNREKRNLAKYNSLLLLARNIPYAGPDMTFNKDIMVMIEYVDLYEEPHIKYYRNGYLVDQDTYDKHSVYLAGHEASIDNFDIWEYRKKYPDSLSDIRTNF